MSLRIDWCFKLLFHQFGSPLSAEPESKFHNRENDWQPCSNLKTNP